MAMLSGLTTAAGGELNPLLPSPVAVIAVLIVGALGFVTLVAAGVFLGIRLAAPRRSAEPAPAQTPDTRTPH